MTPRGPRLRARLLLSQLAVVAVALGTLALGVSLVGPPAFDAAMGPGMGGMMDEMAGVFGKSLARAAQSAKKSARATLLGKPAPWTIQGDDGRVLVAEGKPLTDAAIAAEASRGRSAALSGAVAGGALGRSLAKRRKKKSR